MITEIEGNALDFNGFNVLVHCANCCNTMGSGIALQIKNEYPAAYQADCEAAKKGENRLGAMSRAVLPSGKIIINLYGQHNYGREQRQLNYEAFYWGLEQLKLKLEDAFKEGRKYSIGMPYKMGCDRAGGAWSIVRAMIDHLFLDSPINVVIVKYKPKEKNA